MGPKRTRGGADGVGAGSATRGRAKRVRRGGGAPPATPSVGGGTVCRSTPASGAATTRREAAAPASTLLLCTHGIRADVTRHHMPRVRASCHRQQEDCCGRIDLDSNLLGRTGRRRKTRDAQRGTSCGPCTVQPPALPAPELAASRSRALCVKTGGLRRRGSRSRSTPRCGRFPSLAQAHGPIHGSARYFCA